MSGADHLQIKISYFFVDKKTQGEWQEHRENAGKTQGILSQSECGNPASRRAKTNICPCNFELAQMWQP